MIPAVITKEWLLSLGACFEQRELFDELWPKGARVNRDNLAKAAANDLSLFWLCMNELNGSRLIAFLEAAEAASDDFMSREGRFKAKGFLVVKEGNKEAIEEYNRRIVDIFCWAMLGEKLDGKVMPEDRPSVKVSQDE